MIPPKRSTRTPLEVIRRRSAYMEMMQRAGEYSIQDVRSCLQKQKQTTLTPPESTEVFKLACLCELTDSPIRTLHRYKEVMEACMVHGNPDAHYVEGIKQYFVLRSPQKGIRHLQVSAEEFHEEGNYLLAFINLITGNHDEGKERLDRFQWKKDLYPVDRIWKEVKRSLMAVPIVKKTVYGENLLRLLPPPLCSLNDLNDRCTECFYYKQAAKFIEMIGRR